MEDVITSYSVKVKDTVKEDITNKSKALGKTQGEFIEDMLGAYEIVQSREDLHEVKELQTLQSYLTRIEQVYVEMARGRLDGEGFLKDKIAQLDIQLKDSLVAKMKFEEELKKLSEDTHKEILVADEKVKLMREETDNEVVEVKLALSHAEEDRRQAQQVVGMTENVMQQLNDQIELLKTSNISIKKAAKDSLEYEDKMRIVIAEDTRVIDTMRNDIQNNTYIYERSLEELKQKYEIEKQRVVLTLEREFNTERRKLQDDITALREQLSQEKDKLSIERDRLTTEREKLIEESKKNTGTPKNTVKNPRVKSTPIK